MARLFVENLSVIDFSYLDSERGIVGESWIVDIELLGSLDDQGMVFDFGSIKKQIKQFIDTEVDHRLLVPIASSRCSTRLHNDELFIEFPLTAGGVISHQSPQDAVLLVDDEVIKARSIVDDLQTRIKTILPNNVTEVVINLRNEEINGAYYHYTHGLQKHLGQCQRIAHGHRSQIEVHIDGKRNQGIETQWASRLQDGYIATEDHIIETFELNGITHTKLAYTAQQGYFSISLPSARVFIMPTKTTVENIAVYLADITSRENKIKVLVKAYEGVGKGAYAFREAV
ncbi:6-carboxytetrahydropterin synthase [Pseudomonadales bacterium]|nr:6-carboxytetrahydropterin synthase [Pseudomonadales bacterium]